MKANNISITWPGSDAPYIKDLDLRVSKGEFIAVVGSVGCGKSALLRALSGNMFTAGDISIDGEVALVE